jgi:diguanylate cyclase (GGDEF)-like protein
MWVDSEKIEGVRLAQFQSFATKMPAYYVTLAAMMAVTAYSFHGAAPRWLALGIPACFFIVSLVAGYWWWWHRTFVPKESKAHQYLTLATIALVVTVAAIVWMDISLFGWGNSHQRYFIIVHLVFVAVSGFFCLMHLQLAAATVAIIVGAPVIWLSCSMDQPSDHAIALDAVAMVVLMIFTMVRYQSDFIHLVRSRGETQRLSQENVRLANIDTLTGLQNRRQFFAALQLQSRPPSGPVVSPFAVGIIDLDGFKPVNDTHGHRVGDAVLAEVATRLLHASGEVAHLCRVGGDEFAFIVPGARDEAKLLELGQHLIASLRRPIKVGDLQTSVGCSIGFSVYPDVAETADLLYERADYALYHAKRTGRSKAVFFSAEHQKLIREQGAIEQTLRQADLDTEFYPVFQPVVDANSGRTMAFECLARWSSPTLGDVPPAIFIPVAEHAGLIGNLTSVILRKALEAARHWPIDVDLSFNASPYDIASRDCIAAMIRLIDESGIAPQRIAIEITESALLKNFTQANTHIAMMRDIGIMISLDDFGTGYSSLSYVHALRFDKIKVDRSFIHDIQTNPTSKNIVRSVIALCRDMKVSCVIEGVETDEQLRVVKELGGHCIQGFLFSRPLSEQKVSGYLTDERAGFTYQR